MKTLKLLTVLGLLLAVSGSASALSFRHGYQGPVNIQYTFVTEQYTYTAADEDANALNVEGVSVNWGIYKVDTIYEEDNTTILWQDGDDPVNELSGIIYSLRDQAYGVPISGAYVPAFYGNGIEISLYEVPTGTYATLSVVPGATALWDPATPSVYPGLTDIAPIALHGNGAAIIDPTQLPGGQDLYSYNEEISPLPALYEQKTRIEFNPLNSDEATGGASTAFFDWDNGYLFEDTAAPPPGVIANVMQDWYFKDPVNFTETMGRQSMATATQSFVTTDTTLTGFPEGETGDATFETAGWNFMSHQNLGSIETTVIPEPLTMIALFGGVAGLGGYIRKRRMA